MRRYRRIFAPDRPSLHHGEVLISASEGLDQVASTMCALVSGRSHYRAAPMAMVASTKAVVAGRIVDPIGAPARVR